MIYEENEIFGSRIFVRDARAHRLHRGIITTSWYTQTPFVDQLNPEHVGRGFDHDPPSSSSATSSSSSSSKSLIRAFRRSCLPRSIPSWEPS
jgi:hypothetical protein